MRVKQAEELNVLPSDVIPFMNEWKILLGDGTYNDSLVGYQKKGFFARNYDRAMEVYVNSLLAGFQTHWVNMVGNGMFQLQTLAETGIASRIGGVRQGVQRMLGQERRDHGNS